MSEDRIDILHTSFNRSIIVTSVDDSISANAGVLLLREADHKLRITEDLADKLYDPRLQSHIRYSYAELLRARLFGFACGYSRQDDADELAHDPAFRAAVWNRAGDNVTAERLASQSGHSRLIDCLVDGDNLKVLCDYLAEPVIRHRQVRTDHKIKSATADIDGFPVTVYGNQEGAAYNGYYLRKVYSPLAAHLSASGDLDDPRASSGFINAKLRNGDAAPAEGALAFMLETYAKAMTFCEHVDLRADAAFAIGEIMDELADRDIHFTMRLRDNPTLKRIAAANVLRPSGRPPADGYEWAVDLGPYQASTWRHAQRLILVIVDQPDQTGHLQLFPHYFFLVTNWTESERSANDLLEHYRRRGTFEDRFGELNQSLHTRLSQPKFAENEATLLLSLLAYNLAETLRRETESVTGSGWDLSRFQRTVLQTGARLVKGGGRVRFLLMRPFARIWTMLAKRLSHWGDQLARPVKRGIPLPPPPAHAFLTYTPRL